MTKLLLITVGVLALADTVFFLLFLWQKSRARNYGELYREAQRHNEEIAAQIGKLQAAEAIRQEERRKADEKIGNAYTGNARERFDAINGGLRKHGN